jgi:hypothetical protein
VNVYMCAYVQVSMCSCVDAYVHVCVCVYVIKRMIKHGGKRCPCEFGNHQANQSCNAF